MATGVLLSDTGYKYSIWQVLCMMQSLSLWLCTASHTAAQLTSGLSAFYLYSEQLYILDIFWHEIMSNTLAKIVSYVGNMTNGHYMLSCSLLLSVVNLPSPASVQVVSEITKAFLM